MKRPTLPVQSPSHLVLELDEDAEQPPRRQVLGQERNGSVVSMLEEIRLREIRHEAHSILNRVQHAETQSGRFHQQDSDDDSEDLKYRKRPGKRLQKRHGRHEAVLKPPEEPEQTAQETQQPLQSPSSSSSSAFGSSLTVFPFALQQQPRPSPSSSSTFPSDPSSRSFGWNSDPNQSHDVGQAHNSQGSSYEYFSSAEGIAHTVNWRVAAESKSFKSDCSAACATPVTLADPNPGGATYSSLPVSSVTGTSCADTSGQSLAPSPWLSKPSSKCKPQSPQEQFAPRRSKRIELLKRYPGHRSKDFDVDSTGGTLLRQEETTCVRPSSPEPKRELSPPLSMKTAYEKLDSLRRRRPSDARPTHCVRPSSPEPTSETSPTLSVKTAQEKLDALRRRVRAKEAVEKVEHAKGEPPDENDAPRANIIQHKGPPLPASSVPHLFGGHAVSRMSLGLIRTRSTKRQKAEEGCSPGSEPALKIRKKRKPLQPSDESVGTITEANARRLPREVLEVGVALFIKPHWCEEILSGRKTWEIRGCQAKKRGIFAISVSTKKHLAGSACIVDCIHVANRDSDGVLQAVKPELDLNLPENLAKHRIPPENLGIISYTKVYAWVLEKPRRFEQPIPFKAKSGSVLWSRLSVIKEQRTESQCAFDFTR